MGTLMDCCNLRAKKYATAEIPPKRDALSALGDTIFQVPRGTATGA